MAGVSAGLADAHQQGRHDNLHRQSAIPGQINLGTVGVLNAASDSARRLHSLGVSVRQLHKLLEVSHTIDMNLGSSIERNNQDVERLVAEHIVVGHAPCTRFAMDTLTISQHGCRCQENLPNGSCCQTYGMSHAVQLDERQQASGDAHFISSGISSNVPGSQQSAIISGSLDQRPRALEPRLHLADRRALRMTGRLGFGLTVVHIHVVDITVFQQPRGRAKQNRQRQVHYAICAVRSPRHLILDIQSAGSASLEYVAETWTLYGLLSKSRGLCESQTRVLNWQPVHSIFRLYLFASLGCVFFNQCSLPVASLMGMTAFITFNVED